MQFFTNRPGHPAFFMAALPLFLAALLYARNAPADTLSVGAPSVSGAQYTFPIILNSDSSDVSIMDFQFQYDPQLFRPIEARPGTQASFSNKIINANQNTPGEYIVVVWGPNQNTIPSGDVAHIVMEYTGTGAPNTELGINRLTMANPDGQQVTANSQNLDLRSGTQPPQEDSPESPEQTPPDDDIPPPTAGDPPPETGEAPATPGFFPTKPPMQESDRTSGQSAETPAQIAADHSPPPQLLEHEQLAQLIEDARQLRQTLPQPGQAVPIGDVDKKNSFDLSQNRGTMPSRSDRADADTHREPPLGQSGAPAPQLGPAGDTGISGADSAKNPSDGGTLPRNMLYFLGGGLLIGLIVLLSLRGKFFA